jgi:hypothetical protein
MPSARAKHGGVRFQYARPKRRSSVSCSAQRRSAHSVSTYREDLATDGRGIERVLDPGSRCYETAFAGFNATLRDYARLGMLLANRWRTWRAADHTGRMGSRGDDAVGQAVRAWNDGRCAGLRLSDVATWAARSGNSYYVSPRTGRYVAPSSGLVYGAHRGRQLEHVVNGELLSLWNALTSDALTAQLR